MFFGHRLGHLPVEDLGRHYIAQDPCPPGNQERRVAELAADHPGFFQKINIPAALGTMDEDVDFFFGRNFHFRWGRRWTQIFRILNTKNFMGHR